ADNGFQTGARLLARNALDVGLRKFFRAAHFRHANVDRLERHADLSEQFATARRLRGEPEHRARIAGGSTPPALGKLLFSLVIPESRSDIRDPVPLHRVAKSHWIPAFLAPQGAAIHGRSPRRGNDE